MTPAANPYSVQLLQRYADEDVADYTNRFAPIVEGLFRPQNYDSAVSSASQRVKTSFAQLPGMLDRRRQSLGVSAYGDQAQAEGRRLSLQRAIADADAGTRAIRGMKAQRRGIQSAAFDFAQEDSQLAARLTGGVAEAEASRELDYLRQDDAYLRAKKKYKGSKLGLIGTIAGAVIGGYFGGGQGASMGASAGGSLGSAIGGS